MALEHTGLISLTGIARLARVKRPVVSMWRTRSRDSDAPFPEPAALDGSRELFNVHNVAAWLVRTGRGNNPDAQQDAAGAALVDRLADIDVPTRDALAALIALSAIVDERITTLGADEIIDRADDADPDDDAILTEIEAAADSLEALAETASDLVDTAYSHSAALAEIEGKGHGAGSFRSGSGLTQAGESLLLDLAHDIIHGVPSVDVEAPVIADVTGSATGFAAAFAAALPESFSPVVAVPPEERAEARRIVRQLLVNGIGLADVTPDVRTVGESARPTIRVVTLDDDSNTAASLSRLSERLAELDSSERALVYGPSRVLTDAGVSSDVDRWRAEQIRSGQLRAIVKLPRGLIAARPRQALAIWVLAPSPASVPLSDRWTLIADASDRELDAVTTSGIIDDVVAALGEYDTLRAHAFSVGRPVRTSALAAAPGSLVASQGAVTHAPEMIERASTREIPARIDEVLASLDEFGAEFSERVEATSLAPSLRTSDVASLLSERHLRYAAGTRLAEAELRADSGYRVITPDAVRQGSVANTPFVDRFAFSAEHPNAQLTEPGDVIFVTGSSPAAIVDDDGANVVAYPARVLRINANDPAGLVASLVAADIRRQSSSEWKTWTLRRIVGGQRHALHDTLESIEREQRALQAKLDALHSLSELVADGVAAGRITLTSPDSQPKGTR